MFLSEPSAEPEAAKAAAAAVAQQVQQDHTPAPLHQAAGPGVGGLGGAVGLAGVLHPAQVHLVFHIVGVQLDGAAGVLQRVDAVAQALVCEGGEVIPAGAAGGHAVQHPPGLRIAAIDHKVAGGLHLRAVGAGSAGPALLVAAETEPEAKRVEAVEPVKAALVAVAVLIALLAVAALGAVAIGAAALRAGGAFGDGVVGLLHFLEVLLGGGVVGVQVRVPALAFGAVCFFDLVVACAALDAQHLIRVFHGSTSSRLILRGRIAAQCFYSTVSAGENQAEKRLILRPCRFSGRLWQSCSHI